MDVVDDLTLTELYDDEGVSEMKYELLDVAEVVGRFIDEMVEELVYSEAEVETDELLRGIEFVNVVELTEIWLVDEDICVDIEDDTVKLGRALLVEGFVPHSQSLI